MFEGEISFIGEAYFFTYVIKVLFEVFESADEVDTVVEFFLGFGKNSGGNELFEGIFFDTFVPLAAFGFIDEVEV